jgi:Helix-turn-helix domain
LPLIPDGATRITDIVSVVRQNGRWTYFIGVQATFSHDKHDRRSFRMYAAQLIDRGACRQVDLIQAFGVTKSSLDRAVKKLRAGGVEAFFAPRPRRGASVMKPEVRANAQQLLAHVPRYAS